MNAIRDATDIIRTDEEKLMEIAKRRIENFPILKQIYDDNYVSILARNKYNYDNLLLHWLVTSNPVAIGVFQDVEENLNLLKPEDGVRKFKAKLRRWNTTYLESAIVELEFAADYKRRGYQIELEPCLPNCRKGDFCATKDSMKLYFEVKTIFWERSLKDQAIMDELLDRLDSFDEPFIVGVDIRKHFQRRQTAEVARFIRKKLIQLEETLVSIPVSFHYPESGEPIVSVDVHRRLSDEERGFISGFTFGGGLKGDWSDLRSKITSGVGQLHPNYPGVLVVRPYGLDTLRYDVENALLGDPKVDLHSDRVLRGPDRIFKKGKNERLSAVIYSEERLQESGYNTKTRFVYHNPYAKTKLSTNVFEGENVIQFT